MIRTLSIFCACWVACSGLAKAASTFLIKDGEPHARIVIAPDAPRMVNLAATELADYLQQMSGARLPIENEPGDSGEVNIFIGRSEFTDALGIDDKDLKYGAFRMKSGPGYFVLLGQDKDYIPTEMDQKKWEGLTEAKWQNPVTEGGHFNSEAGIWSFDEGGSLYAVYEFLRQLGFRWFMPGELGVVIPEAKTLELPALDKTVRPDYPVRFWIWAGKRFATFPKDAVLFDRRVGAGARYEVLGNTQLTHGIRNVHAHESTREDHPEYFAMVGGVRDTTGKGTGHACFSSQGLQKEVTNYARAVFDHAGVQLVQLSPQDGFRQCECPDCIRMSPSDNVFGFIDRVAKDVQQTHPDQFILIAGYGSYRQPPASVEKLNRNLVVSINNMGRPRFLDEANWTSYQELVNDWIARLGSEKILRVENTRYDSDPIPAIHPRAIARDLQALRGISWGERNELLNERDFPGSTHLNRYVMGRFYWDANQDIEALLADYYEKFYGPAAESMKAAFDFAEAHPFGLSASGTNKDFHSRQIDIMTNQIAFWEKVDAARKIAGDTVYGARIGTLQSEIPVPLPKLRERLAKLINDGDPRAKAPKVIAADLRSGAKPQEYRLGGMREGDDTPEIPTTFTLAWEGNELIVNIVCREPDMKNQQSSSSVMFGDNISILLETPYHSYYQIEVNPKGETFEKVWNADEGENWASQAIVETSTGEDHWRVSVRIPVANVEEGQGDPLHFVVGEKPTSEQPWYFNIGRVRQRDDVKQAFLFSPLGEKGNFHQPARFARLVVE